MFRVMLLSTKGADANKWRQLVSKHPQRDVYFLPEYAMLFEAAEGEVRRAFGGEASLFFCGNNSNYIVYPFFKRRISELPFSHLLPEEAQDWCDIVSPYGYSGPLPYITDPLLEDRLWGRFIEEFHDYCLENEIVAEFARLHPYIANHLPVQKLASTDVKKRASIVYIELEQDEAFIRKNMSRGKKSSISKATRNGVKVFRSKAEEDIYTFYQLYTATMQRNRAKEAYFFPRQFFRNLFLLLEDNAELLSACYNDQVIAAMLLLSNGNYIHYYLGGSDSDFQFLRPNDLLFYKAILWAKAQGHKIFNLGGGNEPGDSLYQFKYSFSKTTADFYIYSRIHDEEKYQILCHFRDEYDKISGKEIVKSDYFPEYRR